MLQHVVTFEQGGTTAFFIGNANVSTVNGFQVPGTVGTSYTLSFSGPLYCITASGVSTVYVIETVKGG